MGEAAYVLAAVLALPLGGPGARLALALPLAWALGGGGEGPWIGPAVRGGLTGFVAGLPVRAAGTLGLRPPGGGLYGRAAGWAVFFAVGGPVLWLDGLALGLGPATAPVGRWLVSVLLLGLPVWAVELVRWPLAGLLGPRRAPGGLRSARAPAVAFAVLATLPLTIEWMAALWR